MQYLWAKGFQDGNLNVKENQLTVAMMFRTHAAKQVGMFDESLVRDSAAAENKETQY